MALNIKPLGDRVVIEPLEEDVATFAGGELVLPDTAKEKPQQGKILAVGAGRLDDEGERIPMEVKVGDRYPLFERERHPGHLGIIIIRFSKENRNGKATSFQ
jgi:co-chaperonin GroES (HSP10)